MLHQRMSLRFCQLMYDAHPIHKFFRSRFAATEIEHRVCNSHHLTKYHIVYTPHGNFSLYNVEIDEKMTDHYYYLSIIA